MTPTVSVIVQTYNHERFIADALEGVLAQKADFPIEIIVTEDCSTDNTRAVLEDYAKRHVGRIKFMLSERNLNNNYVFTRALNSASGKYIANIDGDDYWTDPTKLQRQVDLLEANPFASGCFHNVQAVHDEGDFPPHRLIHWPIPEQVGFETILDSNDVPNSAALVRRRALYPLPGWFEEGEFQDWSMWIRATMDGPLLYVDEIHGVYRFHRNGMWTGLGESERQRRNVAFLELVERTIDPARAPIVARALVAFRARLAGVVAG